MADRSAHPRATVAAGGGRAPDGPTLHLDLLGGFRVRVGARAVADDDWRLQKARALVKVLALAPGFRLPREQVMDLLWPEADAQAARHNFSYALHVARRALDRDAGGATIAPSLLRLAGGILSIAAPGGVALDTAAFSAGADAARAGDDPAAYREAIARYPGDLLPDDRYEDWAAGPREALRERFLDLLVALAGLHERRGEAGAAREVLHQILALVPDHEDAHVALMRLFAAAGQRSLALRQYALLREALQRDLGVEPAAASQRLYAAILAGHAPAEPPPGAPRAAGPAARHNLPAPLSGFIGRERELAELRARFGPGAAAPSPAPRLLSLIGAGGCGKTRLALELARQLLPDYPDGIWLAELATLTRPEQVAGALVGVLRLREEPGVGAAELLARALGGRHLLIVLDNCEHLRETCARLAADLLARCPGLRVLATSRIPLQLPGELIWRVPSLALPPDDADPAALAASDAVRFFRDQAALRDPAFAATPGALGTIAAICRRLDGLPLALELAAGRLPALSPAELAARLDDALPLLASPGSIRPSRQRTLRATLDWSHALLAAAEAALFRRLAVFVGGWTLDAAESIGGGSASPAAVLDLLAALVDASLVQVEVPARAGARYRLLEPVRQYAAERLAASADGEAARARHAAYFLALAEKAATSLYDGRQDRRLEPEGGNLRAALGWYAARGEAAAGLRLAGALGSFWRAHDRAREGWGWLTRAFAAGAGTAAPAVRARAHYAAATLADFNLGDFPAARAEAEAALALYRELGDQDGVSLALVALGKIARSRGDLDLAREQLAAALALARERAARALVSGGLVPALVFLAGVEIDAGNHTAAVAHYAEALPLARRDGQARLVATAASGLVVARLLLGQTDGLRELLAESIAIFRETGDRPSLAMMLGIGAMVALGEGDPALAVRLAGAGDRFRATHALPLTAIEAPHFARASAIARAALGAEAYDAAWAAGREWGTDEALAAATRR